MAIAAAQPVAAGAINATGRSLRAARMAAFSGSSLSSLSSGAIFSEESGAGLLGNILDVDDTYS
jgi:hypothetical protein